MSLWLPRCQSSPDLETALRPSAGIASSSLSGSGPVSLALLLQDQIDLADVEPGQRDVEADVEETLELEREKVAIPTGFERQLIVGDDERPHLVVAQVLEPDRRHVGNAEELRRADPAMAGDDAVRLINEDGIREPAALDRAGDLLQLLLGVRAGVALIGFELANRKVLDLVGHAALLLGAAHEKGASPVMVDPFHPGKDQIIRHRAL